MFANGVHFCRHILRIELCITTVTPMLHNIMQGTRVLALCPTEVPLYFSRTTPYGYMSCVAAVVVAAATTAAAVFIALAQKFYMAAGSSMDQNKFANSMLIRHKRKCGASWCKLYDMVDTK